MVPDKYDKNSFTKEDESVSLGNKLLYDFCEQYELDNSVNALVAKLWIIGRSYAASPERRRYKTEGISKEKGKGTDLFFSKLAEYIINSNEYEDIVKQVNAIKTDTYKYDKKEDATLLAKTIHLVVCFNRMLKKSIIHFDNKDESLEIEDVKINNFISFASKLMHFHLPKTMFIIDQYSRQNAFHKEKNEFIHFSDSIKCRIEESSYETFKEDVASYAKTKDETFELNSVEKEYFKHAILCYLYMLKLHEQLNNATVTPRMVDNFLLH